MAFTCSKSKIEVMEKGVKYVPNRQIKTPERRQWRPSGVVVVNSEQSPHLFPVFLLLTLNK